VSDLWEKKYNHGNLYPSFNPAADPDGDGWTNAQEATAGTDPGSSSGLTGLVRPEITHTQAVYLSPDEEGGEPELLTPEVMTVTWPTVTGKKYSLLFSPDLTGASWTAIGGPRIGAGTPIGTSIPLTQPDGSTPGRIFWRVSAADIDTDSDNLTNSEEAELGSDAFKRNHPSVRRLKSLGRCDLIARIAPCHADTTPTKKSPVSSENFKITTAAPPTFAASTGSHPRLLPTGDADLKSPLPASRTLPNSSNLKSEPSPIGCLPPVHSSS
jgi:hypothetical protein